MQWDAAANSAPNTHDAGAGVERKRNDVVDDLCDSPGFVVAWRTDLLHFRGIHSHSAHRGGSSPGDQTDSGSPPRGVTIRCVPGGFLRPPAAGGAGGRRQPGRVEKESGGCASKAARRG